MVRRVLIVGGGIGGLSLSVALRDRGIDVDIVELSTEWKVSGIGIIQQSNVVRAMAQLGLVDQYLSASFPFEDVGLYHPVTGERLAVMPGRRLAGAQYPANLGISRPALHEVLVSAARMKGRTIRLGLTVSSLAQKDDGVRVNFTDGSEGFYDLVVGADGIYSTVRTMLFGDEFRPRFTGQSTWRCVFPRLESIDHLAVYGRAGLVPMSKDTMYMFLVSDEPGNPHMPGDQLADLMRARLQTFGGLIGKLRDSITNPADVAYKPLEVVFIPKPWFHGRVLLIGDAAHATTPHLGQGAGMAIEDAVVLGQEITADDPIDTVLERFMSRRLPRCEFVCKSSEEVGEVQMRGSPPGAETAIVTRMLERTAEPI